MKNVKPITDAELKQLKNFIGYGVTKPDVWFIGMEEAGGGEENIRTRCHFDTFEDLKEAHKKLGVLRYHEDRRVCQPQWWKMSKIMLKLNDLSTEREDIRNYQSHQLGQKHSNTLLSDLMPIPKPKIKQWDYEELIPQYKNREDYYEKCKFERINYLKSFVKNNGQPALTICHGGAFRKDFKQIFDNFNFLDKGVFSVAEDKEHIIIIGNLFSGITMNNASDQIYDLVEEHKKKYLSSSFWKRVFKKNVPL